jgi:hypothetical protein
MRDVGSGAPLLIIATLSGAATDERAIFQDFVYQLSAEEVAVLGARPGPTELVFRLRQREMLSTVVYIDDVVLEICD